MFYVLKQSRQVQRSSRCCNNWQVSHYENSPWEILCFPNVWTRRWYRICWKNLLSHVLVLLDVVCRILLRCTRQSLSPGCLVVQLKLDQLGIGVVDHGALLLNIHGKSCCCTFMMDIVAVVHQAQLQKPSSYHGHIDRRDIDVAALRSTVPDRVRGPIYPRAFYGLGIIFCLFPAIFMSKKPQSLAAVEDTNTPRINPSNEQRPEDITACVMSFEQLFLQLYSWKLRY